MWVVTIANAKGGSGKTTVSTTLASAFAQRGLRTALVDMDPQRCATRWVQLRSSALSPIRLLELDELDAQEASLDRVVIDLPARVRREELEDVVKRADRILVPVMPSMFDEVGTARFLGKLSELKPVRRGRRPVATIGNRLRARSKAAGRLDRFLEELAFAPVARLRDAAMYGELAATGMGLFDLPASKAGPARDDWEALLTFVEHDLEPPPVGARPG